MSMEEAYAARIKALCEEYIKEYSSTHEEWLNLQKRDSESSFGFSAKQKHDGLYLEFYFTDERRGKSYKATCNPDDSSDWIVTPI